MSETWKDSQLIFDTHLAFSNLRKTLQSRKLSAKEYNFIMTRLDEMKRILTNEGHEK